MADAAKPNAVRLVELALNAILVAAKEGHPQARRIHAFVSSRYGRPAIDDDADLAEICAGESLSDVSRRRSAASGQSYPTVRHRLAAKLGRKYIRPAG